MPAEFPSKDVYKDFFVYLLTTAMDKNDSKFACDSFFWSYTTRKRKNLKDGYIICLDMDHSSLFNEPDDEHEEDEDDGDEDEDEDDRPNKDRWLLKTVIRLLRDASLYEYDDDEYGDDDEYDDDDDDDGANIGQKLTAVNDDDHDNYDDDDEEEDEYDEEDDDDDDDDPRRRRLYYGCQDPPMYALRDIKAGEELKMSYDEFSEPEGWEALGIEYGILNIDTV